VTDAAVPNTRQRGADTVADKQRKRCELRDETQKKAWEAKGGSARRLNDRSGTETFARKCLSRTSFGSTLRTAVVIPKSSENV